MNYFKSNIISVEHQHLINEVIENSRVDFFKENVGEEVLQKLRAIWERKTLEKNIAPPVAHPFSSVKGNVQKKKSSQSKRSTRSLQKPSTITFEPPPPLINLQLVNNIICNRSMPLLTSEEEDEPTSLPKINIGEKISEFKEKTIFNKPFLLPGQEFIKRELDVLQRYKNIINKILVVKICQLKKENTNIIKLTSMEPPNSNVLQKNKRYRSKKCPFLTTRKKKRKILKIKQIKHITSTNTQKFSQNHNNCQQCTIMQTDGPPDNPKFNIKSQFTGCPVKTTQGDDTELNADDDITDNEDFSQIFECNNVIHCQYENVKRRKKNWKINLKYGVMYLKGKEYFFNNANFNVKW